MNVSAFYIYMIDVADAVKSVAIVASLLLVVWAVILFSVCFILEFNNERVAKCLRTVLVALFGFLAIAVFVPSGKTLVACKVVPAIAKSEVVNEIPQALLKFIRKYTEEN